MNFSKEIFTLLRIFMMMKQPWQFIYIRNQRKFIRNKFSSHIYRRSRILYYPLFILWRIRFDNTFDNYDNEKEMYCISNHYAISSIHSYPYEKSDRYLPPFKLWKFHSCLVWKISNEMNGLSIILMSNSCNDCKNVIILWTVTYCV